MSAADLLSSTIAALASAGRSDLVGQWRTAVAALRPLGGAVAEGHIWIDLPATEARRERAVRDGMTVLLELLGEAQHRHQ